MLEPTWGTEEHVGELLATAGVGRDLLDRLGPPTRPTPRQLCPAIDVVITAPGAGQMRMTSDGGRGTVQLTRR